VGILVVQGSGVLVAQRIRDALIHEVAQPWTLRSMVVPTEEVLVVVDETSRLVGVGFVVARLHFLSVVQRRRLREIIEEQLPCLEVQLVLPKVVLPAQVVVCGGDHLVIDVVEIVQEDAQMVESRLDDFVIHDDSQSFVEKLVAAFLAWLAFFRGWVLSDDLLFHGDFVLHHLVSLRFGHISDHAGIVACSSLEHVGGLGDQLLECGVLAHIDHVEDHLLEIKGRVLAVGFSSDDSQQYFVDSLDLHDKRKLGRCFDAMVPREHQQGVDVVRVGLYANRF